MSRPDHALASTVAFLRHWRVDTVTAGEYAEREGLKASCARQRLVAAAAAGYLRRVEDGGALVHYEPTDALYPPRLAVGPPATPTES